MLAVAVWMRILERLVLDVQTTADFGSHGFNEFLQGLSGSGQSQTGEVAGQGERARFHEIAAPTPWPRLAAWAGDERREVQTRGRPFNAISRVRNGVL